MTEWHVDSVGYTAVTQWSNTTQTAGNVIRQLASPTVGNERCFIYTTGGATAGSEPTETLTKGALTTDGSAVMQECTGIAGLNGNNAAATNASAATSGATASGSNVLTFSAVPAQIAIGKYIVDTTTKAVIPANTTVIYFDSTHVWMSANAQGAGVGSGDTIAFSGQKCWYDYHGVNPPLGTCIQDNAGTHLFMCTVSSGNAGATEPTWVTSSPGSTTSDGSNTWTYVGTTASFSTAFGAPFARLTAAGTTNWAAAGDTIWVSSNHAETQAANMAMIPAGTLASPTYVYCATSTKQNPGNADLTTGATVTTTGAFNMAIYGSGASSSIYVYGISFSCGSGANSESFTINNTSGAANAQLRFDSCALSLGGTTGGNITMGADGGGNNTVYLNNTTLGFASTSSVIQVSQGVTFRWLNTISALQGAAVPTTLFGGAGSNNPPALCWLEGVDLSAAGAGKTIAGTANGFFGKFVNCKINASVTLAATPASPDIYDDFIRCDSGATNYTQARYGYQGTLAQSATIVRTGGASDGTTPLSWQIITTANSHWFSPFEAFPIPMWNDTTGSPITVTLHGIWNAPVLDAGALPHTDDVWVDIQSMNSSATPISAGTTGTKANQLASGVAWASDSVSAWDSLASAWISNHAYTTGAIISGTSVGNSGRLFICTTSGTSTTGAAPGTFASAVDGGAVTDNTAVWTAMVRFTMAVTVTSPALAGPVYAYLKAAKPSVTFYVDPKISPALT